MNRMRTTHALSALWTVWMWCICSVVAQQAAPVAHLPEDTVTVTYTLPLTAWMPGSRESTLPTPLARRFQGMQAAAWGRAMGFTLREYSSGGVATFSIRGMQAGHTALLWQGYSLNAPTLGLTDFNTLYIFSGSGLSFVSGSTGTLAGNYALGGILNMDPPLPTKDTTQLLLLYRMGSFGQYRYQATASAGGSKLRWRVGVLYDKNENNYTYLDYSTAAQETRQQKGAGMESLQSMADVYYNINKISHLSSHLLLGKTLRMLPPPLLTADINEYQKDNHLKSSVAYHRTTKHVLWRGISLSSAYFYDELLYHSDNTHSYSPSHGWGTIARANGSKGRFHWLLKAESRYQHARTPGYAEGKSQWRQYLSASVGYHNPALQTRLYAGLGLNTRDKGGLFAAPYISGASTLLSHPTHLLQWKYQITTGFRQPTLNDLYWQPGGNPELKAERSLNAETGLKWAVCTVDASLTVEATAYHIWLKDRILWMPGATFWSPYNISSSVSYGTELSMDGQLKTGAFRHHLLINHRYTRTYGTAAERGDPVPAGKQLLYTPYHTFSGMYLLQYKHIGIGLAYAYTGYRYTDATYTRYLDAYGLTDLWAEYRLTMKTHQLTLRAEVNNVADVRYESMPFRPMPGRMWAFSIVADIKQPKNKKQ